MPPPEGDHCNLGHPVGLQWALVTPVLVQHQWLVHRAVILRDLVAVGHPNQPGAVKGLGAG